MQSERLSWAEYKREKFRTNTRLQKIPKLLLENGGSLSAAMREAGYGPGYSSNPQMLSRTDGFQKLMQPIIKQMEDARQQALKRMGETVEDADYAAVSASAERLTKQIQLLSDKPTENFNVNNLSSLTDEQLQAIIARASDRGGSGGGEEGDGTSQAP